MAGKSVTKKQQQTNVEVNVMKSKCGISPIKLSLLLQLFPPLPDQEIFAINKREKPY